MFCPFCGKQMPIMGKFCVFCGANLEMDSLELNPLEMVNSEKFTDEEDTYIDSEIVTENDYELSCGGYVAVNNDMLDISLLDENKIHYFKENYFNGKMFVFPLGQYTISYTEDVVTYINAQVYFKFVAKDIMNYCEGVFKTKVSGWESFLKIIPGLYQECMRRIVSMTVKMMVASGIMIYTEKSIEEMFGETSCVLDTLQACAEEYEDIMREYATAENIREMNRMSSENSGYVAGGFGFKGVLGGIAAAELANAGSQVVRSIKNNMAKSSNKTKLQEELDKVAKNPDILDSFKTDIMLRTAEMLVVYVKACEKECHVKLMSYGSVQVENIGRNTINYVKDPETILKNLSEALTLAPMLKDDAMPFLIDNFYRNKEIVEQILALADFYLQGKEIREHLDKLRSKELRNALDLPEQTSLQIYEKIAKVREEADKIGYEITEEIEILNQKLEKKKKGEREKALNGALQLPEHTLLEIETKIARVREEADKIGYDVSEKINSMEKKKIRMERQENEANYNKALKLPEDSVALLEEKISSINIEAKKSNIDCSDVIQELKNKIAKKEEEEIKKKLEEKGEEILVEVCVILEDMIQDNNLEEYLHGIYAQDEQTFFEDTARFKPFADLYAPYLKDDMPIICYDDTLLKSARDGFMLTNKKLLIADMGKVQKVKVEKIQELIPVEKTFSLGILVNNTYKIPVVMAGKKNIRPMIKCIEYAVCVAKFINALLAAKSEEELEEAFAKFKELTSKDGMMDKVVEEKYGVVKAPQMMGMIHCPQCGNEIKPGKNFCSQCGMKISR